MKDLFEQFIKEKEFLCGLSPKSISSYRQAFNVYQRVLSKSSVTVDTYIERGLRLPTKDTLKDFVVGMREQGINPGGCNSYIRSFNSFLTWLHENEHTTEQLKVKQLPKPQTVIKIFSEKHVQALIKFRPKDQYEWRLHTLICLLTDTGIRIDECLTCLVSNVNLDDLIIKVRGKGNKERLVPISVEMRKILWIYLNRHRFKVSSGYLFPTRDGNRLEYNNVLRDIKALCGRLGISGVRMSPHSFRHYYAVNFIRQGGDIFRLSRILGHTSVSTTQLYLRSMGVEMVQEIHQQLSPLSRY